MSDKVQITIPKNAFTVHYTDSNEKVEWTFERCVRYVLDNTKKFNDNGVGIRRAVEIFAAIDGVAECEPSKPLNREHVKALSEELENPEPGYMPSLSTVDADGNKVPKVIPGRTFLPYLDAVADALKAE